MEKPFHRKAHTRKVKGKLVFVKQSGVLPPEEDDPVAYYAHKIAIDPKITSLKAAIKAFGKVLHKKYGTLEGYDDPQFCEDAAEIILDRYELPEHWKKKPKAQKERSEPRRTEQKPAESKYITVDAVTSSGVDKRRGIKLSDNFALTEDFPGATKPADFTLTHLHTGMRVVGVDFIGINKLQDVVKDLDKTGIFDAKTVAEFQDKHKKFGMPIKSVLDVAIENAKHRRGIKIPFDKPEKEMKITYLHKEDDLSNDMELNELKEAAGKMRDTPGMLENFLRIDQRNYAEKDLPAAQAQLRNILDVADTAAKDLDDYVKNYPTGKSDSELVEILDRKVVLPVNLKSWADLDHAVNIVDNISETLEKLQDPYVSKIVATHLTPLSLKLNDMLNWVRSNARKNYV